VTESPPRRVGAGEPAPVAHLLVLCTGNAARSVMAGYMFDHLAERRGLGLTVVTAGTHTLEGQPMGLRTRTALGTIGELGELPLAQHRSHQVVGDDFVRAQLVVTMEADHVRYVRKVHPVAAARTASLRYLCAALPAGPAPLNERVAAAALGSVALDDETDVADPAGRDQDAYDACALELWGLCAVLIDRL
jgi:protein-tyrosine-phosphatase